MRAAHRALLSWKPKRFSTSRFKPWCRLIGRASVQNRALRYLSVRLRNYSSNYSKNTHVRVYQSGDFGFVKLSILADFPTLGPVNFILLH